MINKTIHEDSLSEELIMLKSDLSDSVAHHQGALNYEEDILHQQVAANIAIAHAINNLSRAIRDSFGSSTEGASFIEKIAMVLDEKL